MTAQTFTILHSFTGGSDGANPRSELIDSDATLYGTTQGGGTGFGTVFALRTDGSGFTNLHRFAGYPSDGAIPYAGLLFSGNMLYGIAHDGGVTNNGTVFKINTDGTDFTNLHSFAGPPKFPPNSYPSVPNIEGINPAAGLVFANNALYGTTRFGGSLGYGAVFTVNTDGSGFTNLHSFASGDGFGIYGRLVLLGNTFYGTAGQGGSSGAGTVFAINTDGSGFTNLHNFISSEGRLPLASLVMSGNRLYGEAESGGNYNNGSIFGLNTDGSNFTNLHSLKASSDGSAPDGKLLLVGNVLYGTAVNGGAYGFGTVFCINTNGTGFTTLHNFIGGSGGANPFSGLARIGNTLYGTTYQGGNSNYGTVFSLSFRPQLTIVRSETNVVLTWPSNFAGFDYTGFTLQFTTNLVSPAVWSSNSPAPVVFNGQNTVTNAISGTQKFYRLSQ